MPTTDLSNSDHLRLLIVDDEPHALRRLEQCLSGLPGVEVVGSARNGDAALEEVRRLKPDLVILDVEMPGRNGIAVATMLDPAGGTEIIIHSGFDRYATSAFEIEALDYLVKPLRPERLRQALDRTRRRRSERSAHTCLQQGSQFKEQAVVHVPDRNGGYDVPASDLIWIEAARDYALLHTGTRSHIVRATMAELSERIPDDFLRVHRSAIVALSRVRRWGLPTRGVHSLILSDGTEVGVGPKLRCECQNGAAIDWRVNRLLIRSRSRLVSRAVGRWR